MNVIFATIVFASISVTAALSYRMRSLDRYCRGSGAGQFAYAPDCHKFVNCGAGLAYLQGLNSIEFQQDVQQGFQQSTSHSVWLNALLKIPLNSLLKFN